MPLYYPALVMEDDGDHGRRHGRPKNQTPTDHACTMSDKSKRAQVARACKRCANSKRKCNGTFPCERCVRMGQADSCEEVETKRAKGDESADPHSGSYAAVALASTSATGARTRRKRPADDDGRSDSGVSVAMSRARLEDGKASHRSEIRPIAEVKAASSSSSSDKELYVNLDFLLRASGDSSNDVDALSGGAPVGAAMDAARAQVRAALRVHHLLPKNVEIAPNVVVDLDPPPGVLVDATADPISLAPYPAVRLSFARHAGDGQPVAIAFNAEALALFGASAEALPRAVIPGAYAPSGPCLPVPLWLHPDEVGPRARLAAYVRARGGRYYEWPGRYVCTVWREVSPDSADASHPEAVMQATKRVLVPRHVLFCAWERVFLCYHPRLSGTEQGQGRPGLAHKAHARSIAHTLSVFTCIEPLDQELYVAWNAHTHPARAAVTSAQSQLSGSASNGVQLQPNTMKLRYSFGAGYLPDPHAAAANLNPISALAGAQSSSWTTDVDAHERRAGSSASYSLDSSLAALSGVGVKRLSIVSARRATAASVAGGGHGLSFDLGSGLGFGAGAGMGARHSSFGGSVGSFDLMSTSQGHGLGAAVNGVSNSGGLGSGVPGRSPSVLYRTAMSFSSTGSRDERLSSLPAPASAAVVRTPASSPPLAPAPDGPLFFVDGPHEPVRFKHVDAEGRPVGTGGGGGRVEGSGTMRIAFPSSVPRACLDDGGSWDWDAEEGETAQANVQAQVRSGGSVMHYGAAGAIRDLPVPLPLPSPGGTLPLHLRGIPSFEVPTRPRTASSSSYAGLSQGGGLSQGYVHGLLPNLSPGGPSGQLHSSSLMTGPMSGGPGFAGGGGGGVRSVAASSVGVGGYLIGQYNALSSSYGPSLGNMPMSVPASTRLLPSFSDGPFVNIGMRFSDGGLGFQQGFGPGPGVTFPITHGAGPGLGGVPHHDTVQLRMSSDSMGLGQR